MVALKTLNMFLKKKFREAVHPCKHQKKLAYNSGAAPPHYYTAEKPGMSQLRDIFFFEGGGCDVSAEVPLFHPISVRMSITETANLQSRLQFPHVKVTCFINQLCSTALLHSYN